MPTEGDVREALRSVSDPEVPVLSILDLGVVESVRVDGDALEVVLLPTFTGCPALGFIQAAVEERLRCLPGVRQVHVHYRLEPAWSSERISDAGRLALRSFGIAPPGASAICPYCGSRHTRVESAFGPTRCRATYYCEDCKNPFERMKAI